MNIVMWVFGVLLILSGGLQMVTGAPLSGLLYIVAGAVVLPLLRETLAGYRVRGPIKAAVMVALLVLSTALNPTLKEGVGASQEPAQQEPVAEETAVEPDAEPGETDQAEAEPGPEASAAAEAEPEPEPVAEPEPEPDPELTGRKKVDADLRAIVAEYYNNTTVDKITLNDNLGTDAEGDFVALIYLTWSVKNKADTTKKVIAMYSEDFAARIGTSVPEVTDTAMFWTIPYFQESGSVAKYSYERHSSGGMYKTDETWDAVVR